MFWSRSGLVAPVWSGLAKPLGALNGRFDWPDLKNCESEFVKISRN